MLDQIGTALALGVSYGLGPCTISCAPLMVPIIAANAKNKTEGLLLSLEFSAGRILAYSTLGFVSGLIGKELNLGVNKILMGIVFMLLGIAIILKLQNRCILHTGFKFNGPLMVFVAGLVMGFGPCPPLIALLGATMATRSAVTGAVMGLVFGLATIISPLVVLGPLSGWIAQKKEFTEALPYVSGGFLIIMGIIYMV